MIFGFASKALLTLIKYSLKISDSPPTLETIQFFLKSLLRLRVTQKALQFSFDFFSFTSVLLNGLTEAV